MTAPTPLSLSNFVGLADQVYNDENIQKQVGDTLTIKEEKRARFNFIPPHGFACQPCRGLGVGQHAVQHPRLA